VGLASERGSILGVVNVIASSVLAVVMLLAVVFHLRKGDPFQVVCACLVLFGAGGLQVIFRLAEFSVAGGCA